MRRYLMLFVLTVAALVTIYAAAVVYQIGAPVRAEYWVRDARILKVHIAESATSPKLVILGGSSGLFAYDSAQIQQGIGRPAVNLAIHAGLSLDYMFDYTRPVLRPHDILLLAFEYETYSRRQSSSWYSSNIMAWDPQYFERLGAAAKLDLAVSVPGARIAKGVLAQMFHQRLEATRRLKAPAAVLAEAEVAWRDPSRMWNEPLYSIRRLDPHGDMQIDGASHDGPRRATSPSEYADVPSVWHRLKEFGDYCAQNKVQLFVIWPSLPPAHAAAMYSTMDRIEENVRRVGISTIGHPRDAVLDERF